MGEDDRWAETYDADIAQKGGGENVGGLCCARVLVRYCEQQGLEPSARPAMVDIGCGTGYAAPFLRDAGWADMVGLDLSRGSEL